MNLDSSSRSHTAVTIAGIALIVAPLVAFVIKGFSTGWMTFFIMLALIVIVPGYILQLVIAIGAFLRRHGAIGAAPNRGRAVTAAWVTSIGVVLLGFFMIDGGDQDWGSTFMYLFGLQSNGPVGDVSAMLGWAAGVAWVGGWVWLVVEWILALVQRRRVAA